MSEYLAEVCWQRQDAEPYVDNKYSRAHRWRFDGGAEIEASSSPHVVPLPYSVEAGVDPEEAFVASLSSCHMLFFLSIAAKKKMHSKPWMRNKLNKSNMPEKYLLPTNVSECLTQRYWIHTLLHCFSIY